MGEGEGKGVAKGVEVSGGAGGIMRYRRFGTMV